jgi:hypothetical protein
LPRVDHSDGAPFSYAAVQIELGRPGTGVEFGSAGVGLDVYPYGSVTIDEQGPPVATTVVSSGGSTGTSIVPESRLLVWRYRASPSGCAESTHSATARRAAPCTTALG